ncbi:hypothetical protein Dda_9190 [Drechslerella dactyloides]|uniref:F-box domain-containing protein n=1 Tax=Drechslerella dactyloides TaxID=74499 RepID=A0AAD6IPM3_DREDA|nr:hypothetical protein Dda_9190 [Drechslerella dactyloides]
MSLTTPRHRRLAVSRSGSPLPTYEAATSRDPVACAARYLRREDLFSCALVCRVWRRAVDEELWGYPTLCFGFGEKTPLTSFLLFLRVLPVVHPARRARVHTMRLERCVAGLYTTLPETWFADLLRLLPGLHRLSARGLPFLDRRSLRADAEHHALHTLDISNLTNTTAASLVSLFARTPALRVLDLSHTVGAGHADVLRCIGTQLQNLRSLALRSLSLTDDAVGILARSVQVRLERLDVADNLLTDGVVDHLLDWCFMPPDFAVAVDNNDIIPEPHDEEKGVQGLRHLHVAGNRLTATGIHRLLASTRLRTLDVGAVYTPTPRARRDSIVTLVTAITQYGFRRLQNLRIHTSFILLDARATTDGITTATLLSTRRLPSLTTLTLTNVPAVTADGTFVTSLQGLLDSLTASSVKTLVLEVGGESDGGEFLADADSDTAAFFDRANGDFSFFEDEKSGPVAGGGSIATYETAEVAVVDVVRRWREDCRRRGSVWSGNDKSPGNLDYPEKLRAVNGEMFCGSDGFRKTRCADSCGPCQPPLQNEHENEGGIGLCSYPSHWI